MNRGSAGLVLAAAASLVLVAAGAPAHASDRQAIDRAVATSLAPGDIAPALGAYKATYSGTVFENYQSTWTVCTPSNPNRAASFEGMDTEVRIFFAKKNESSKQSTQQSLFLFATPAAAREAFTKAQTQSRRCTGSSTERIESDDPSDVIEWQSTLSNSAMNAVSGVPTFTVTNDWTRAIGGDVDVRQDEVNSFSLVNNAIIRVEYRRSPDGSPTKKEMRGLQATTKAAIENYQRQRAPRRGSVQARFATSTASLVGVRDIPASLGRQRAWNSEEMQLESGRDRIWICDPEGNQFSDEGATAAFAGITSNPVRVSASFDRNRDGSLSQVIMDFGSTQRAQRAFAELQTQAQKCKGTFTQNIEGAGDGDGEAFSGTLTRRYTVGEKRISGSTPSITIENRLTSDIPVVGPPTTSGAYDVWTLSGSRVVWLVFTSEAPTTAKQRAGVEELTATAVGKLR